MEFASILGLALETWLTAHDASYLQLSRTLGLPLVTLDVELRRAAGLKTGLE